MPFQELQIFKILSSGLGTFNSNQSSAEMIVYQIYID